MSKIPYIHPDLRPLVDKTIDALTRAIDKVSVDNREGLMTYVIYKLLVDTYAYADAVPKWQKRSEAIKVLECAKLEYYVRKMTPYETAKIAENGDV